MRIQLIFAPPLTGSAFAVLAENMWPPMGIMSLAAYLREDLDDVEIKLTDGCKIGYARTLAEIRGFQPDVVGISFYTMVAHGAMSLAREVKSMFPLCVVIMGGPHATALPAATLQHSEADIVVVGEGEESFRAVVKTIRGGQGVSACASLPGVWTRDAAGVHGNDAADFITPLDRIPLPARDLVDMKSYKGWFLTKAQPETIVMWARGCPYHCTFCSCAVWKSSKPVLRLREPGNVVSELKMLRDEFGIREVFDNSDEFNNNYAHALSVCKEISEAGLDMSWKAQLRAKPFTDELAQAMADAGCWYVHLGVESGNQATLDGVGKHIKLEEVEETLAIIKRHGLKVLALFMLFNVWEEDGELRFEDEAATKRTLDFMWKLVREGLADYVSWSVATPYPGSKLYDIALRHNLIKPEFLEDWEAWQRDDLFVMQLPGVDGSAQRRIKRKGEWLRLKCMLASRDFQLKDIGFLVRRALHVLAMTFRRN